MKVINKTWPRLTAALLGCALLGASTMSSATMLQLDFSGTITSSFDNRGPGETVGRLFGASPLVNQNGLTISGRVYIDDTIYTDSAPQANIGVYGGSSNAFRSIYTIDGKTFDSNWFQNIIGAPYSSEQAALYDPVNPNQDFFTLYDTEVYKPIYNQGSYGQVSFSLYLLSNQAIKNFLNGTALDQVVTLGTADFSSFIQATGTYNLDLYCGWLGGFEITAGGFCPNGGNYPEAPFGVTLDSFGRGVGPATGSLTAQAVSARGEFTLNSLTLQRAQATGDVPEPNIIALLGLGLMGLFATRRNQ